MGTKQRTIAFAFAAAVSLSLAAGTAHAQRQCPAGGGTTGGTTGGAATAALTGLTTGTPAAQLAALAQLRQQALLAYQQGLLGSGLQAQSVLANPAFQQQSLIGTLQQLQQQNAQLTAAMQQLQLQNAQLLAALQQQQQLSQLQGRTVSAGR